MFQKTKDKLLLYKTLVANFGYLSVLEIFNIALPLITYPYLIRVLGKDTYGLIVYAQAIASYFVLLITYGFNISAVKHVSINRNKKTKLNEIFSSVMIIKFTMLVLSFIILFVSFLFTSYSKETQILFFISMWVCLYDFLFPIWYFQGIEKMKYMTIITLVSRFLFLALIFILIKKQSDYLLVPVISGMGVLISGSIAMYIIFVKHKVKFVIPSFTKIKFYFLDSTPIFLSNLSIKLYVNTNKVIIGSFIGMSGVAYYDLAEKITTVFKTPLSILSQSLFPKISKDKDVNFVKKIFKISVLVNFFLFLLIILTSKYMVLTLAGESMVSAISIVNLLAFTIPLIAMSNVFGIQLLLSFGYNKIFSRVIIISGVFYFCLFLLFWSLDLLTLFNITLMTILTELFVTTYLFYFCKKLKLWT